MEEPPDTKPIGMDEEWAVATDLELIAATLGEQLEQLRRCHEGPGLAKYQNFLFGARLLTGKVDPAQFIVGNESF